MANLPLVRGIAQALYPFVARIEFSTGVCYFADGTEQRWKRRPPLFRFQLTYRSLMGTDQAALLSAFNGQKGAFASNLQAVLTNAPGIGATFSNLAYDADQLTFLQRGPGVFDTRFELRQTQNRAFSIPSVSATFPTLSPGSGVLTQWPYEAGWRNLTTYGDSQYGVRYGSSWWDGSMGGNFPSRALRYFTLSNPVLPNADVTTLVNFFLWCQGRLQTFSYKDPLSGTTYSHCHMASDAIEIQYKDVSQTQIGMAIVEGVN